MTVYLLFHETNTGHSDPSDGYVEAIYATEEAAELARMVALREARDAGRAIWQDPDDLDDEGNVFWEHDWRVEAHDVRESVSCPEAPPVRA